MAFIDELNKIDPVQIRIDRELQNEDSIAGSAASSIQRMAMSKARNGQAHEIRGYVSSDGEGDYYLIEDIQWATILSEELNIERLRTKISGKIAELGFRTYSVERTRTIFPRNEYGECSTFRDCTTMNKLRAAMNKPHYGYIFSIMVRW